MWAAQSELLLDIKLDCRCPITDKRNGLRTFEFGLLRKNLDIEKSRSENGKLNSPVETLNPRDMPFGDPPAVG